MNDRVHLGGWRITFGPFGSALTLAIMFGVFTVGLATVGFVLLGGPGPAAWWLLGVAALTLTITVIAVVFTVRIARDARRNTHRRMSSDVMLGLIMGILGGGVAVATGIALVVVALLGGFDDGP